MGVGSSKQRLGERVLAAQKKLAADQKMQSARAAQIMAASPGTLEVLVQSIADSFQRCSPFSDSTLLVAFEANREEVMRIVTKSCKQVLSAPIRKEEYEWFKQYVFPSSIWMMRTKHNTFMFEEMLKITRSMSEKIDNSMHSIYTHLTSHAEWKNVQSIKNQDVVERQDDDRVGLLMDKGIKTVSEAKDQEEHEGDNMMTFIDSNLAVDILTAAAKKITPEFQGRMRTVMSRYGDFKSGPVKTVERCQSKLENDYQEAAYPKAAKLLDLVRCSVSFNTVEQLLTGYDGLMKFIQTTSDI